jgi:hypothetical protein
MSSCSCCVLHDLGLSAQGDTDERFEVAGADLASDFLRSKGTETAKIAVVWDAIGQVLRDPAKYSPVTFAGGLAQAHPGGRDLPSWFDALAAAPWGDQPIPGSTS